MKKTNKLYYFVGIILIPYILFFSLFNKWLNLTLIEFFTGLGAIGTVSSLLFIYTQILKSEEQFIKSTKPLLFPISCKFFALKPTLNTIYHDKYVLNKIIDFSPIFDNTIEIKCLKNEALNISLSIIKDEIVMTNRTYLFGNINDFFSIELPDDFAVKLAEVDPLEASVSQGDAYDELTQKLKYTLKIEYQDINGHHHTDFFDIKIDTSMKSFDIVRTVANINFKKLN